MHSSGKFGVGFQWFGCVKPNMIYCKHPQRVDFNLHPQHDLFSEKKTKSSFSLSFIIQATFKNGSPPPPKKKHKPWNGWRFVMAKINLRWHLLPSTSKGWRFTGMWRQLAGTFHRLGRCEKLLLRRRKLQEKLVFLTSVVEKTYNYYL